MHFVQKTIFGLATLAVVAIAENPISSYHYLADPSAASDGDTFYILTDTDDMCVSTSAFDYNIVGLYAFSSKDMVNWTDHGMIFQSKREFSYVGNTWASGIAVHNGKIYIVYPDGAGGVGMITSKDIAGPYIDPIALGYNNKYHKIAGHWGDNVLEGCDDIANCFDPGIFIEDDGTGYVIFGGGESAKRPHGNNFDIVKFVENGDAITIDKSSLTRISAPKSFEAPYIHKYKGTYYLSYNNTDQVISYGTSSKITGPYYDKGTFVPSTYGINLYGNKHLGGNNHQGAAEFKGNWYAVYHDRRLVTSPEHPSSLGIANPEPGNHRSVSIDQFTYNADGTINPVKFTDAGPAQVGKFDPYNTYKALTSSKQRNVRSRTDWTKGQAVKHVLTPLSGSNKDSWIRVTGVDFGSKGATRFAIEAASVANGNKVEVRKGSSSGTLAGTCNLQNTGSWSKYANNECEVSGLSGVVDQLFLVFKGSADSTMGLLNWEFMQGAPEPQTPYNATKTPWAIPGKIEAENFDVPGVGNGNDSYSDTDVGNNGDSDYRKGTDVDIKKGATGNVIGWSAKDEWLEYTINVASTGKYTMFAAVASANGSSFKLSVDGNAVTEIVEVPKAVAGEENYDDYNKVAATVNLTAGNHILRLTVVDPWFDIDYMTFVAGENAKDPEPIQKEESSSSSAISSSSEKSSSSSVLESSSSLPVSSSSIESSDSFESETSSSSEIETSSSSLDDFESSSSFDDESFIANRTQFNVQQQVYKVYSMQGKLLGSVNLNGLSAPEALNRSGFRAGVYMLRGKNKSMMVNANR